MSRVMRCKPSNDGDRDLPNLKDFIIEGNEEGSDIPRLREMPIEFFIQCAEDKETDVRV